MYSNVFKCIQMQREGERQRERERDRGLIHTILIFIHMCVIYVFKCMCSIYICVHMCSNVCVQYICVFICVQMYVFICVQMYVEYIHCNFIRHNSIIYVSDPIRIRSELDNFRTTLPLSLSIRNSIISIRFSLSPSLYVLCDSLPVLHDTIRLYDTSYTIRPMRLSPSLGLRVRVLG